METFQWYDYLRMTTATLCLISGVLFFRRVRTQRATATTYVRDVWWVLFALLFLMVEGSIEQVITNVPWGARTLLSFFVSLVCFKAMLTKNKAYTKHE